MDLTLEIRTGDDAGRRFPVPPGSSLRVGRLLPAEIRLAADPMLSGEHFSIQCDEGGCCVKDLGSRFGTTVNGQKVIESLVQDGDEIRAGRTVFVVLLIGGPPRSETRPDVSALTPTPSFFEPAVSPVVLHGPDALTLTPMKAAVLKHLQQVRGPLYALVDAAREQSIPGRLERAGHEFESLYEGGRGDELAAFGPWLVRIQSNAPLLEELVRDGWGNSWGVYLTCDRPLVEVRKHLRQFLLVKLPDGRQVYFRYYDPRVLRTYLPTCTSSEVREFLGPIALYIAEGTEDDQVLEFASTFRDWRKAM